MSGVSADENARADQRRGRFQMRLRRIPYPRGDRSRQCSAEHQYIFQDGLGVLAAGVSSWFWSRVLVHLGADEGDSRDGLASVALNSRSCIAFSRSSICAIEGSEEATYLFVAIGA